MRKILHAYRSNPIKPDAALELVEYAKKYGGYIRVTYKDANGGEKKVLLRPEGTGLVIRNIRQLLDAQGNQLPTPDAAYQETLDPRSVLVTAPSKVEGDLRIKYKRPDGTVVTAVVTPVGAAFVGTDPRTLESLPVASIRSMRQTIDLNDIDTMAYRAEKDIDEIISDEGGAFRFLSLDFPFAFDTGGRKYNSIHTAVVGQFAGPETQKAIKKANSYDVPLVDLSDRWVNEKGEITEFAQKFTAGALRTKFSQAPFQRWLTSTGTRPFALPEYFGIDINATLDELRAEALKGGVQPAALPPAKPTLARGAVLGAAPTAAVVKEAEGYLRTLAQQRLAYSQSLRGPDAPEIVEIDPYEMRRGEKPVDAIIYIRALGRKGIDKIPDTILAVTQPPIPYMVIDEPENVEDEGPARRAIKWLLEHPLWNRIGLAVASRSPYSKMIAAQTLDYLAMIEAALQDPDLRAEASREVSLRFDDAGNVISPIGGKVAGAVKGARGYKIAFESPVELTRDSLRKADLSRHTISELAETMATITEAITADDKFLRILEKADAEALAPLVEEAERRATADNRNVLSAVQEAKKKATNENIGNVGRLADSARDLKDEVRNLAISVNAAMDAATTRSGDMQKSFDPIVAAKRDRGELETALRYANTAAVLMSRYLQLVTRSMTSAEDLGRLLRRQDLGQIGRHFRKILVTPGTGLSDRYKRHNNLIDTVQEQLRKIPPELMSDSRSDNMKGLQKYYPYPGHEVEYFYSGSKLYRYVYLELPIGMTPVNVKKGDILSIGSVIEVEGARRDIPAARAEKFSIDTAIIISQSFAINCAPVNVEVTPLGTPITDRDELVLTVNGLLETQSLNLRRQAAEAKVLEADENKATSALAEIYKKLGPNNFMDNCARDPKFVEDPVFYVLLTGPSGAYFVADGPTAPREVHARLGFLEEMQKKYGPSAVVYFDADTRRIMSDIPLDVNRLPLLRKLTGYQEMTIQKTILAGSVGDGFFEYSPARPFSGKGLAATKQEAQKQLREKEVAGRFFATGTSSSGGTGAAGKVFIGKTDKPRSGPVVSGGLGTAGKMAPGRYDPGTGGTMTLMVGREKLEDQMRKGYEVQTAYIVGAKDRWGRYMEQLDEQRKMTAPTAKERAMATYRAGQLAQDEGPDEPEAAHQTTRQTVSADDDPFGLLNNPLLRYRRNTNGEPPEPPRRRRVAPGASAVGSDQIRTPEVAPAAAPSAAAAEVAASPFAATGGGAPPAVGTLPSEDANLAGLRKKAADAWRVFVKALRTHGKQSSEEGEPGRRRAALKGLLAAYTEALGVLERVLDTRDRAMLNGPAGEARLRALLHSEAEAYMDIARSAYTRASRGDKVQPTQTQLERVASWAAQSLDAFGRPLAPPSISEMAAAGLPPLDISSARIADTRLTPAARARALPAAMSFSDLKKAAEIAAKAAKRDDKGISTSAVACRVLQPNRMVAFKLAGEPFHQMLFRQFGAKKEVAKFRTLLLWFSPDSSHVIFYVNGVATCEFHVDGALSDKEQFPQLVGDVLKYTEDWFNDPREGERRKDYRVLAGKSGCIRLYQIWGATPQPSAALRKSRGPFVAQVAVETMISVGLFGNEGDQLGFYCPEKATGVARVWADKGIAGRFVNEDGSEMTPEGAVAEERAAYTKALSEAGYGQRAPWARSYEIAMTGPSAFVKATATQAANEVEAALQTPTNHVTLFYPAMYSEDGVLDRAELSLTTGEELRTHLDRLAQAATSGTVFNVIDASLFSETVLLNVMSGFFEFDPDEYFRPPNPLEVREGIKQRVVPPALYLFKMLTDAGKNNITINLITRLSYNLQNNESFTGVMKEFASKDLPIRLVLKAASEGGALMSLKQDFEHGSRLILWNTPDMPNADSFFGRRNGIRDIADIAAANFGLIREIMVESSGYERTEKKTIEQKTATGATEEIVRPFIFSLPELLRKDMVDILRRAIVSGLRAGRPYAAILGVPERIGQEIEKLAENKTAQAAAEIAIDVTAAAYGGKGSQFFRYGPRFVPERENRGRRLPRRR